MLSLKKYWDAPDAQEAARAFRRALNLLLEGILLNSAIADPADHALFRQNLERLASNLVAEETSPEEMLVTVGGIIETYQEYHQTIERRVRAQKADLLDMVAMLTGVLTRIWAGNERAVTSLCGIERQLRQASRTDDIRVIKSRLEDCISALQSEADLQRRHQAEARQAVRTASEHPVVREAINSREDDPVTGLPGRAQAIARLKAEAEAGRFCYAAPVALGRLGVIKQRFGAEVSEAYLLVVSQLIAQGLRAGDSLYRWSGASFLMLLAREEGPEAVRAEVGRLASARTSCSLAVHGRSLLLPVALTATCFPVWQAADASEWVHQIDSFVIKNTS